MSHNGTQAPMVLKKRDFPTHGFQYLLMTEGITIRSGKTAHHSDAYHSEAFA